MQYKKNTHPSQATDINRQQTRGTWRGESEKRESQSTLMEANKRFTTVRTTQSVEEGR